MRVVLYSGGALSWAAAMRTIEAHGRDGVRLLFTDTSMEDEDLYRFLDESEGQLGKDVSILLDREFGDTQPLTLREFRTRLEAGETMEDLFGIGGCGCFVDA